MQLQSISVKLIITWSLQFEDIFTECYSLNEELIKMK